MSWCIYIINSNPDLDWKLEGSSCCHCQLFEFIQTYYWCQLYLWLMEGSKSCCRIIESVQKHSISMWKAGMDQAKFNLTHHDSVSIGCGDCSRHKTQISTLSNHLLYKSQDNGRIIMMSIAWISPNTVDLGAKSSCLICLKLSPPCDDDYTWFIPILIFSNLLSYSYL